MTDTTAPAADDLREAVKQQIYDWIAVAIDGDDYEICGRIEAAAAILALIAPRIAAARAEGRREGIEAAAPLIASLRADLRRFGVDDVTRCEKCGAPIDHDEEQASLDDYDGCWPAAVGDERAPCYRYRTAEGADLTWPPCPLADATAIRALADAPRQDAGGMTEGG